MIELLLIYLLIQTAAPTNLVIVKKIPVENRIRDWSKYKISWSTYRQLNKRVQPIAPLDRW